MYKRGFYGGKFLPFHKGHKYCIEVMAKECEEAVVIFFTNSEDEDKIMEGYGPREEYLEMENRRKAIKEECSKYKNVRYAELDCAVMHQKALEEGTDTWDAETPFVLDLVGDFQAVFSSEPGYDAYFKRAYPFATHRLVDPPRVHVPISGTKIRGMEEKEAVEWL